MLNQLPQLSVVNKPHGNGQTWTMYSSTPDDAEYAYTLQAIIYWSWEGGGTTRITWMLHDDGQDVRVYPTHAEWESAWQAVKDNEGEVVAAQWVDNHWSLRDCDAYGYCGIRDRMRDIERRWDALRLLVNPAVHL